MALMGPRNRAPVARNRIVMDLPEMPFVNRRSPVQSGSPAPLSFNHFCIGLDCHAVAVSGFVTVPLGIVLNSGIVASP